MDIVRPSDKDCQLQMGRIPARRYEAQREADTPYSEADIYIYILQNYAKEGDLILDTHVGSASSLIACEKLGFKYIGCELDENYYRESLERLETFKRQVTIWDLEL